MATEFAPAKVNLTLHVTGRRPDGYHLLDSLVVFAGIGDRLSVEPDDALRLTVTGPLAAGVPTDATNLALRAASLMAKGRGARIRLDKVLPHGAGIGGGSADAAAALRALARLWRVALPDDAAVLSLGADVPVCLQAPHPARMEGIGERITPVGPLPPLWLVLVNPGVPVPTGQVFARLREAQGVANPPMDPLPADADLDRFVLWLRRQRNDLTAAAVALVPAVAEALDRLAEVSGCLHHGMSGSGSTCWGLFATAPEANAAAKAIARAAPGWWVRAAAVLS